MLQDGDRKFDWVAALALASGALVMIPSMLALAAALVAAVGAIVFG